MTEKDLLVENKNSLKGVDLFLGMVCILFFLDTAIPVASMGPVAIFWALIISLILYIPSSLIIAEQGSTYPDEGGMYVWVKMAYGKKWGARMAWIYWVNNAIWISSLSTFIIGVFCSFFIPSASFASRIVLTLIYIWCLIFICLRPVRESKLLTNVAAIFKLALLGGLVICALYYLSQNEWVPANDFSTMFNPDLEQALTFFPALIYNYIGFEVICSMGKNMKNPAKDFPKASIGVAFLVSCLYMTTAAVMLVIIPLTDLDLINGIMDSFTLVLGTGTIGRAALFVIACMFLYTLITQAATWIVGAARMASTAARDHELPAVFAIMHPKHDTPLGTLLISGCIGTILTIFYGLTASNSEDLYWTLFSFTSMIAFLPYIINYQAFLKMRRIDTQTIRPYRFPGHPFFATFFCRLGQIIFSACIVLFVWVPGYPFDWRAALPLVSGVAISLLAGEYLIKRGVKPTRVD